MPLRPFSSCPSLFSRAPQRPRQTPGSPGGWRRAGSALLAVIALFTVLSTALPAAAQSLPPGVEAALARARVPADAVSMLVVDADGRQPPRLNWRSQVPSNPASIMKLVTTFAALDLLGPAFTWTTPV
jgi:serine-type D-Ala-D-Ala carboxypeptidase/endopeptidase (penicillin-binding protein 4)